MNHIKSKFLLLFLFVLVNASFAKKTIIVANPWKKSGEKVDVKLSGQIELADAWVVGVTTQSLNNSCDWFTYTFSEGWEEKDATFFKFSASLKTPHENPTCALNNVVAGEPGNPKTIDLAKYTLSLIHI